MTEVKETTDCLLVLNRVLRAVSTPIIIGDATLNVSASIGVSMYPQDHVDADKLMRHANQAMYAAKHAGKNRYHFFDPSLERVAKEQTEKLNRIRTAFEQGEFVLHYQPKVNMRTGAVVGAEALIRWQHPVHGLLPPADFLPMIENLPLSITIGEWVIDTALTQIATWQAVGLNLPVSVNIAAIQLQDEFFLKQLSKILALHPEVSPNYLDLEVLETSAVHNMVQVAETMDSCIELGLSFSLDDFGTGYSSLTYFRKLPTKMIKIDQSFVRDMLEDADDLAIIKGVVELTKAFQRTVIAEGVETIEHGTALLQLGCDLAQGYGIARPMPAIEIPDWVANWRPYDSWQTLS